MAIECDGGRRSESTGTFSTVLYRRSRREKGNVNLVNDGDYWKSKSLHLAVKNGNLEGFKALNMFDNCFSIFLFHPWKQLAFINSVEIDDQKYSASIGFFPLISLNHQKLIRLLHFWLFESKEKESKGKREH